MDINKVSYELGLIVDNTECLYLRKKWLVKAVKARIMSDKDVTMEALVGCSTMKQILSEAKALFKEARDIKGPNPFYLIPATRQAAIEISEDIISIAHEELKSDI